jgi:hypothetical protein
MNLKAKNIKISVTHTAPIWFVSHVLESGISPLKRLVLITWKRPKRCDRYSQESTSATGKIDADMTEMLERVYEAKSQVIWRLSNSLSFRSADPSGVGLRSLACWDCGFEWMFVSCECCVFSEFYASGWSLAQRGSTDCGVSERDHETWTAKRPLPIRGWWVMERKITLVAIHFIHYLGSFNETGFVFNCETFYLYRGSPLAEFWFFLWVRYGKQGVRTRKPYVASGRSQYSTEAHYRSRNCEQRNLRKLPFL